MNHMEKIAAHYSKAKEKHPLFADVLITDYERTFCAENLARLRMMTDTRIGGLTFASDVLNCEVAEVYEAIANGRYDDAIEECYDAVAVLLRMAEMIADVDKMAKREAAR